MPQISERSWFVFVVKVCTFKPFSCTQVSGSNDLHASKTIGFGVRNKLGSSAQQGVVSVGIVHNVAF